MLHWAVGSDYPKGPLEPTLCDTCEGVIDVWKQKFDVTHVALRALAKEGAGFRPEVVAFAQITAHQVRTYQLQDFHRGNGQARKKVLTEGIVLRPQAAGVTVEALAPPGQAGAHKWLERFARRVHDADPQAVSALIVLGVRRGIEHPQGFIRSATHAQH